MRLLLAALASEAERLIPRLPALESERLVAAGAPDERAARCVVAGEAPFLEICRLLVLPHALVAAPLAVFVQGSIVDLRLAAAVLTAEELVLPAPVKAQPVAVVAALAFGIAGRDS